MNEPSTTRDGRRRAAVRVLDRASLLVTCAVAGGAWVRLRAEWAAEYDALIVALDALVLVYFMGEVVLRLAWAEDRWHHLRMRWFDLLVLVPLVQLGMGRATAGKWFLVHQVVVLATVFVRSRPVERLASQLWLHPARLLVGSFGGAILAGTLLLCTPWASAEPERVRPVDALFTATSAVCVTGLTVVETGTRFTFFGQMVILVLIQLGGLGIMTFSVSLVLMLGRRLSQPRAVVMRDMLDQDSARDMLSLVRFIVLTTVLIEGLGAMALFAFFAGREGLKGEQVPQRAYEAVFHAISAFCNAGFSLFPRNLEAWVSHAGVNVVIAALIVLGGLGFPVLRDLAFVGRRRRFASGRSPGLQVQTKVVLATSALLIVGGAVLFYLVDAGHTLQDRHAGTRVLASVFQSVTARTAGFNTVPIGAVSKAGLLLLIGLMFIGASPGSTGGGIKTTTAAVLWAASWAALRGRSQVQLFRRTVPRIVVRRALALAVLSALLLTGMALVLMSVERPDQPFEHLVFEIVSAFGTVGLSAGATPKLTDLGRLIITALMFTGRVGPLTLALVFLRERPSADYTYAEERLMVG